MKKYLQHLLLLSLAVTMLFSSCSNATVDDDTKSFVNFFYSVYSPQDTMFELYLTTMSNVVDVLSEDDTVDNTTFEESISILSLAYNEMESISISEVELDDATKTYMEENELSVDVLTGISAVAESNQTFYLEAFDFSLEKLETGMANDDVDVTSIVSYALYQCELFNLYIKYDYYTINSIFVTLSKSEVDYARTYFEKNSLFYNVDEVEWQKTAQKAIEKSNEVWEEIGKLVEEA